MNAGEARAIAKAWVRTHALSQPGFVGAYTAGSINDLPDAVEIPETSDIDVMLVVRHPNGTEKPGKVRFEGVLLEVSLLDAADVMSAEQILGHYHLAGSFFGATILSGPEGHLARLQSVVAELFARREWIEQRVDMAEQTVLNRLDAIATQPSFPAQVMSWLFAVGGVPHVLLVAGLRNPTVRKRYLAVKQVLEASGNAALYPDLLRMLGCGDWTPEKVTRHLDALEGVFDAAAEVIQSPFFFAADISAESKSVAIGGSRELISLGYHREAVFWIVATACRCQLVLHADAPADQAHDHDGTFAALISDLGIENVDDLSRWGDEVRRELPRVRSVAESILDRVATG